MTASDARHLARRATTVRVTARRMAFHVVRDADPVGAELSSAASATEIARHVIGDAITEVLLAVFLDARTRTLGYAEIARGTLNATRFSAKDILIPALYANAHGIILAHNHPSGDATPSSPDRHATAMMREAAGLVGMTLVDHLVVTDDGHYSFADSEGW